MKASPETKWQGHWCLPLSGKPYGFAALTLLGLGIDTTRGSMPSAAPGCCLHLAAVVGGFCGGRAQKEFSEGLLLVSLTC